MSNSYFNFTTGRMVAGENALAEDVNAAFDGVAAGMDLLPTPDQIKFLAGAHETTTGSSGNFVLAVTADAYFDGMAVSFKANHSNSGACTLNVGSLGAKQLVDGNGAALAIGDIVANSIYAARYNSTSDKFHLVGLSSGNAAEAAIVAANITDICTLADNIDELLTVDDNAADAADSASAAQGYAQAAQDQAGYAAGHADAAALSAANLPNATTAGADKVVVSNADGDGWEYPSITAAGKALLDDASATAQRATLGLGSVNNTADVDKPVSTLTQAALDLKADLASTQAALDLKADFASTQAALDLKADLASPALTGNPTAPTQESADNSTKVATTAYVKSLFPGGTGYMYINGTLVQAAKGGSATSAPCIIFPVAFPNSVTCVVFAVTDSALGDLRIYRPASDLTKVGFIRTGTTYVLINIIAWGY